MPSHRHKVGPTEKALANGDGGPPPPIYQLPHTADFANGTSSQIRAGRKRTMTVDGRGELIREQGLSYLATLLNFLKSLVGAGFLSLPLAFKNAGLWATLMLIVLFAFLNCICMMQLVKSAQHHYKQLGIYFLNYGDMASQTCASSFAWIRPYASWAKGIVNVTILFLQFGFCSTYYLFLAVSFKEIAEELTPIRASLLQWLMAIYVPMVLLNFVRTLRLLSFLSAIGNVFMVACMVFIIQFVIRNPRHTIADLPWYNSFDGLLTAAGTIIYSFEAQTLVLPMENKLKRPGQMVGPFGVLSVGILLASLIYSSVGFFGYVAYGAEVEASITLNLPQHQIQFTLVKLAICISVCASFLLQMYVIVELLWAWASRRLFESEEEDLGSYELDLERKAGEEKGGGEEMESEEESERVNACWNLQLPAKFKLGTELLFRLLLVTMCFLFAAAVPNLARIIPLVGITTGMLLSFVFPALLDMLTFAPVLLARGQRWWAKYRIVQNMLLACVGIFGMVAGLRANLRDMMTDSGPPMADGNGTLT